MGMNWPVLGARWWTVDGSRRCSGVCGSTLVHCPCVNFEWLTHCVLCGLQAASIFSHTLNLHNLTEEVYSSLKEKAERMGEVRGADCV